MNEVLRNVQIFAQTIGWRDVLDILIVSIVIYELLKLFRGTQANQILLGLLMIVVVGLIAEALQLRLLSFLYSNGIQAVLIAMFILFQPELRRALDQMGRFGVLRPLRHHISDTVRELDVLRVALVQMSAKKIGCLVVIGQDTGLDDIVSKGVAVDAKITAELLVSLFFPNSPLHDGAAVIFHHRVIAAGCILPLSDAVPAEGKRRIGTRHRAALGMSLASDALVFVVSEETGSIGLAYKGTLHADLSADEAVRLAMSAMGMKAEDADRQEPVVIRNAGAGS